MILQHKVHPPHDLPGSGSVGAGVLSINGGSGDSVTAGTPFRVQVNRKFAQTIAEVT
jgi:hypothetical protein